MYIRYAKQDNAVHYISTQIETRVAHLRNRTFALVDVSQIATLSPVSVRVIGRCKFSRGCTSHARTCTLMRCVIYTRRVSHGCWMSIPSYPDDNLKGGVFRACLGFPLLVPVPPFCQ